MKVKFKTKSDKVNSVSEKQTHSRAKPLTISLDQPGRLRVGHLMSLLSLSHSSIYLRISTHRLPKPDGHDPRPYWNTRTVKTLLES